MPSEGVAVLYGGKAMKSQFGEKGSDSRRQEVDAGPDQSALKT